MEFLHRKDEEYWLTREDFESIPAQEQSLHQQEITPTVSVLMLAWNHAKFIDEAIASIVNQQCDFAFELIIGEDASSDETLSICKAWLQKHPDKIRIVIASKNVGMHQNFSRIWHLSRGEYIALCEGDDYWTDAHKLQKQHDWFMANPQGALVGTFTEKIERNAAGEWVVNGQSAPLKIEAFYSIGDLLHSYSFHFSSVMLKKDLVRFPRWFWQVYCVDRPLYLLAAENGTVGMLPMFTSRYRQHDGGLWSPRSPVAKAGASTDLFCRLEQHLDAAYTNMCRSTLTGILWSYMSEAIEAKDWPAARQLYRQCLRRDFFRLIQTRPKDMLIVFLRIYFPASYQKLKSKNSRKAAI